MYTVVKFCTVRNNERFHGFCGFLYNHESFRDKCLVQQRALSLQMKQKP